MALIGYDVEGIEELRNKISHLSEDIQDEVGDDVSEYLYNVAQIQPPYKYVSRRQAYGTTFFSDKQRRWFFWALREGILNVPYKRTQAFRKGWRKIGSGIKTIIVNETDYGHFLKGPGEQSRMHQLIGWKDTDTDLKERAERIDRIAEAALKRALNKR